MAKLRELISVAKTQLEESNIPGVEARYLAEYVFKLSFTEILQSYEEEMDVDLVDAYHSAVNQRLTHLPLQYITKEQVFCGMTFYVNEHVLIPRGETELLVEKGLEYINALLAKGQTNIKVIDMCTGSGCIAISLAKALYDQHIVSDDRLNKNTFTYTKMKPIKDGFTIGSQMNRKLDRSLELEIVGVDISKKALQVARKNSALVEPGLVSFVESNLFNELTIQKVDLIISNPPYIPPKEIEGLMPEVVDYEPMMALDGGEDGLDFYRLISQEANNYLVDGGMILYEIGHGQMKAVKHILGLNNYKDISGQLDLQQYERMVYGIKLNKPD